MKTKFDGVNLVLPKWKFTNPFVRVPHRHKSLATHTKGKVEFRVACNRPETLFWVKAVGPGLAGDYSRVSSTVTTRCEKLANLWIEFVKSGKVTVEE